MKRKAGPALAVLSLVLVSWKRSAGRKNKCKNAKGTTKRNTSVVEQNELHLERKPGPGGRKKKDFPSRPVTKTERVEGRELTKLAGGGVGGGKTRDSLSKARKKGTAARGCFISRKP